MGTILKISCKSCGSSWQCHTGCGIQHSSLSAVAELFPKSVRKKILDDARQEMFPAFDFELRAAYCPCCNSFESIPVLDLRNGHLFTGVCPTCGREVEIAEDIEKIHCPSCGKASLTAFPAGHWD